MITMINASGEDVIYRIQIDNDIDYSVTPMRECSLVVRSIPLAMIAHKEEVEWNSTDILIELDPKKTLRLEDEPIRMHLGANNLVMGEYPVKAGQKKSKTSKPCFRGLIFILGLLVVMMAAYLS
ncbi:hypothetical protein KR054_002538 [Drosophila jambulina]|nr:hypothetical protein KR054_002538 [Drosophila jambulina]